MPRRGAGFLVVIVACANACDRHPTPTPETTAVGSTPPLAVITAPVADPSPPIAGDARDAARAIFGAPTKPGRLVGVIEPATNGDPQYVGGGVLVSSVSGGRIVTVRSSAGELRIGGPFELGGTSSLATDGRHVCTSDRKSVRCAWLDGSGGNQRVGDTPTTGLWGNAGLMVRGASSGNARWLEASTDGFLTVRKVGLPPRFAAAAVEIESPTYWTAALIPLEGTGKPRFGATSDGRSDVADLGALDRAGWSGGDRLWPDGFVTGALSTEMVVAEKGEKQTTVTLPWSASGAFYFAKGTLMGFGKGATGSGGFVLIELHAHRATNFTPPGAQPIIAAGRVGQALVAITTRGEVLAWP